MPKSPRGHDQDASLEQFFDLAGHELRNPITALKAQVQLMQRRADKIGLGENEVRGLNRMLYHAERLQTGLQVFLDAAHIAQRRVILIPADVPYDLAELAARQARTYGAGDSVHTIEVEHPAGEAITGNWDRTRVEMVLGVLLSNALRYSKGGEVLVRVARDGDVARVEVLDRGLGVPPAERSRVFQAYTHASNVENGGVGLGLYVARAVVRKHGGKMGVRARPGGGSIFWFTLPLAGLPSLMEMAAQMGL